MRAKLNIGFASEFNGKLQEKALACTKMVLFAVMRMSGKCPCKAFSHKLSMAKVARKLGKMPLKPCPKSKTVSSMANLLAHAGIVPALRISLAAKSSCDARLRSLGGIVPSMSLRLICRAVV
eukprot:4024815-Amphidinium_carterae.1